MSFSDKVRGCDKFGAIPSLKINKKRMYGTVGGGIVTLLLRFNIFVYFCVKVTDLFDYAGPSISIYPVLVDRNKGQDMFSLQDYGQDFFFYFANLYAEPVSLDPRIGSFIFTRTSYFYDEQKSAYNVT